MKATSNKQQATSNKQQATSLNLFSNLNLSKYTKKKFINLNTIYVFYGVIYEE
ncbi:hypothetical protein [Brachyspira intermedia]|uniref:hypothetical protein n=1 Tax=Brachyspira intermedia TaxID=84377 RepID=UPI0030051D57